MICEEKFRKMGLSIPKILLPAETVDMKKYAVIACDQYSSDKAYWEDVRRLTEGSLSSLDFIMPEAWLGKDGKADSPAHIKHQELLSSNMKKSLSNGELRELKEGVMLVKRTLKDGSVRTGLLFAVDLECYDYHEGNKALIRATEATVKERIPARAAIRAEAVFEIPHIMLLLADKKNRFFSAAERVKCEKLYDFDLMKASGHLCGYHISDEKALESLADSLSELYDEAKENHDGMLFAVGDGNHSLAAAKANWDEIKKKLGDSERFDHPARFALAEIVNLYDESMIFEPIHRILKNLDPLKIQKDMGFERGKLPDLQDFQPKLDAYLLENPEIEIDYIHGKDECLAMEKASAGKALALCWDYFDRDSLYDDVIKNGRLVRKSFSIGHADDKRFYLEARKITK